MNRYSWNPGDHLVRTVAIDMTEEGALRRLVDFYYMTGQPIADAVKYRVSRAASDTERRATDAALGRLFERRSEGWVYKEADGYLSKRGQPPESWSKAHYDEVFARDGRVCRYCGAGADLSIDHVIPRCQGGGDGPDNLVVACRVCNSRKGGRTPEQAGMVLQ